LKISGDGSDDIHKPMWGLIVLIIANQSSLQRKVAMQENIYVGLLTFFLGPAMVPQLFHSRIATVVSSSSFERVLQTTAWAQRISDQVLSSHSTVSSSRTVRPCSPWGCRWIGHWRTTWSTVCSSAPHSQAAEEAIPHLYMQGRKRPTPASTVDDKMDADFAHFT